MESIGLFTPPAQRMSMSWSTFWRRPEEKKLEPLLASLGGWHHWVSGLRMRHGVASGIASNGRARLPQGFKDLFALFETGQGVDTAEWLNWLAVKIGHSRPP